MTSVSPTPTAYRLDIEAFTLRSDQTDVHYEADSDLFVDYRPKGDRAGLVMVELGIDGYRSHRVRTDVQRFAEDPEMFTYAGDRIAALDDAIEALSAVRDQLATMRTPEQAEAGQRNAFDIGRDYERLSAQ